MNRLLRSNNALRIVALILACILWMIVNAPSGNSNATGQSGIVEKWSLPIHVQIAPDMVVTMQNNTSATIAVRSTMWNAISLSSQMANVQLVVDAEGLTPGKHTLPVLALGMSNVNDTTASISPQTVTVVLETKVTMMKSVKVVLQGKPIQGANVGALSVDNEMVQVSGPSSAVAKVVEVIASVSVSGVSTTFTRNIRLLAVDSKMQSVAGVNVLPNMAMVTVPIQTMVERLRLSAQIVGQPAQGFAVSGVQLSVTTATLYGRPDTPTSTQTWMVPVNVSGMRISGLVTAKVPILPGVAKIDPTTVNANVTIEPAVSRMFTDLPIQVLNLPSSMTVLLPTTTNVSIQVTGPKSIVDKMASQDVTVFVDGSQLKLGENVAQIGVQLPTWVIASQLPIGVVPVRVS